MDERSTLTIVLGVVFIAVGVTFLIAGPYMYVRSRRAHRTVAQWRGIGVSLFAIGELFNGITHLVTMPANIGLILGMTGAVIDVIAAVVLVGLLVRFGPNSLSGFGK